MSLAREMFEIGQRQAAPIEEDSLSVDGDSLTAKVVPIPDIEIQIAESLGRDAREALLIHVTRDKKKIELRSDVKWGNIDLRILRMSDNPTKVHIEYGAMILTEDDK